MQSIGSRNSSGYITSATKRRALEDKRFRPQIQDASDNNVFCKAFFAWLPLLFLVAQIIFSLIVGFNLHEDYFNIEGATTKLGLVAGSFAIVSAVFFLVSWYVKVVSAPEDPNFHFDSTPNIRRSFSSPSSISLFATFLALSHLFADVSVFCVLLSIIVPDSFSDDNIDNSTLTTPLSEQLHECTVLDSISRFSAFLFVASPTVVLISGLIKTLFSSSQSIIDIVETANLFIAQNLGKLIAQMITNPFIFLPIVLAATYSSLSYPEPEALQKFYLFLPTISTLLFVAIFSLLKLCKKDLENEDMFIMFTFLLLCLFVIVWPFVLAKENLDLVTFCNRKTIENSLGLYVLLPIGTAILSGAFLHFSCNNKIRAC